MTDGLTQSCISWHVCKRSISLTDIIEALSRAKLKWPPIHPIILLYGCLSSLNIAANLLQKMWRFSPHPSWWYKNRMVYFSDCLVIWKYLLLLMQDTCIDTLHTHTRKTQANVTRTERKATSIVYALCR